MSIFNELLPNLFEISNLRTKNFNRYLKDALESLDKFEEEFHEQNARSKAREKTHKDKSAMITLQSIDEGEDEAKKISDPAPTKQATSKALSDNQISTDAKLRGPKKRSKNEVDDMHSPEQDKRVKRNASVKAQSIISKQVNVNLSQKMRREKSMDKPEPARQSSRSRRNKDDEKENLAPQDIPVIQIKQEKLSIPSEPMETEALPTDVEIKEERHKDDIAMPPPAAPVPKPRRGVPKEKSQEKPPEETSEEEPSARSRRATRNKKQTDVSAPVPRARATRSASRAPEPEPPAPAPEPEARPKRTRGRKKLSDLRTDSGNATQSSAESAPASPADKPRPKRTRRAQKADKEEPKPIEPEPTVSPKEERQSEEQISSPIITQKQVKAKPKTKKEKAEELARAKQLDKTNSVDQDLTYTKNVDNDLTNTKSTEDSEDKKVNQLVKSNSKDRELTKSQNFAKDLVKSKSEDNDLVKSQNGDKQLIISQSGDKELIKSKSEDKGLAKTTRNGLVSKHSENLFTNSLDQVDTIALDETKILSKHTEMDQTVILPNAVYNHETVSPKNIQMNETVVLEKAMVPIPNGIMDATVILDKGPLPSNLTLDNSLITDDSDTQDDTSYTPPKKGVPETQPLSAVKEKVQQFEEMASRVTRTKTRAMKKAEETDTETQTPPDKVSKAVLSSDTLNKMNSLIFNGKAPQLPSSACKPKANVPSKLVTASASKAAAVSRAREAAEETLRREDAKQKKDALLEAKREQQKRKREEKMAAAAAARSAAERERRALLEAAARERHEKQQLAELERNKLREEAERKKHELARKVAETEERRRAEDAARTQRLVDEQRRAADQRTKRTEELEAMRREEARMAKEIEKRQREYNEKKKKQKIDKMHTPFKTPLTPLGKYLPPLPPVYMEDGFQYLNSDEDAEPPERPVPAWSTSKARRHQLSIQKRIRRHIVDAWFGVGACSPDLAEIFPSIERARLKRTSSAVWHTPPPLPPLRD